MSGELLIVPANCRACGAVLTFDEQHYLGDEDGTGTCNGCESKWLEAVTRWRLADADDPEPMPVRP